MSSEGKKEPPTVVYSRDYLWSINGSASSDGQFVAATEGRCDE
jgi:hypothetical protein